MQKVLILDFGGQDNRLIVNEVRSINRVLYDITSKPPTTGECE